MVLKSAFLIDFLLISFLSALILLLFAEGKSALDAECEKTATSQKEPMVTNGAASLSGCKIIEASVGASIDINSTQCSFTT